MGTIDDRLAALGAVPDHPSLDGFEGRVLASIDARRVQAADSRMTITLAIGAMLVGAVGSTVPYKRATAATPATFVEPGPLAPSTLLLGARDR